MEHIELDPLNETCRMANDNNKNRCGFFNKPEHILAEATSAYLHYIERMHMYLTEPE